MVRNRHNTILIQNKQRHIYKYTHACTGKNTHTYIVKAKLGPTNLHNYTYTPKHIFCHTQKYIDTVTYIQIHS